MPPRKQSRKPKAAPRSKAKKAAPRAKAKKAAPRPKARKSVSFGQNVGRHVKRWRNLDFRATDMIYGVGIVLAILLIVLFARWVNAPDGNKTEGGLGSRIAQRARDVRDEIGNALEIFMAVSLNPIATGRCYWQECPKPRKNCASDCAYVSLINRRYRTLAEKAKRAAEKAEKDTAAAKEKDEKDEKAVPTEKDEKAKEEQVAPLPVRLKEVLDTFGLVPPNDDAKDRRLLTLERYRRTVSRAVSFKTAKGDNRNLVNFVKRLNQWQTKRFDEYQARQKAKENSPAPGGDAPPKKSPPPASGGDASPPAAADAPPKKSPPPASGGDASPPAK